MASEETKDLAATPPPSSLSKLIVGPLALLAMGSIWGLGFALSKVAGEAGAHPVGLIIWETIGSGMLLLMVCAMLGRYPRPRWVYLRNYLINGLLGFTIPGPILFWAAPHLPVAVLTLMIPMAPLLTYVLILCLRIERFDLIRAAGVIAGFVGVACIVLPESSLPEPGQVGWVLLGLGAASFYALQNLYIALHSPPDADILTQTTGMLLMAGVIALPLAAGMDGILWPTFPMTVPVQAAAVMLVINAGMMMLFVWVVRTVGPVFASMTANVITLAGVFWGWVIFREALSPWIWFAIAAMAVGVALVTLRRATPIEK